MRRSRGKRRGEQAIGAVVGGLLLLGLVASYPLFFLGLLLAVLGAALAIRGWRCARAREPVIRPSRVPYPWARTIATRRGELVRSQQEARIANFLLEHGFSYEYEVKLGRYFPDFYLPAHRLFIEYLGLDDAAYEGRTGRKSAYYSSIGANLLWLRPSPHEAIETTLHRALLSRGILVHEIRAPSA